MEIEVLGPRDGGPSKVDASGAGVAGQGVGEDTDDRHSRQEDKGIESSSEYPRPSGKGYLTGRPR